ncbi:MAG: hypothetical protein JWM96_676 [Alphaproteobacteria bacterium]|nr:hypothetical protein [Alphaproteobacteria bacterium]
MRDDIPLWMHIGGDADPGEDLETAMRRETREEADIEVEIVRHVGDFISGYKG